MYRDRPRKFNELNTAITAYIRNVSQADLQKVFANKIKRVQACIDARGHHFQTSTMLPAGGRPATSWVYYTASCNTQSSAPEDGQNNYPKHVQLTGIINKPLLLHLVGCLYYLH